MIARLPPDRVQAWGVTVTLFVSASALAMAPALMPEPYSWLTHTISEAAAQGLEGAWLARLGFVIFGFAVLWLTYLSRDRWNRWATASHVSFALALLAVAAFSHKPFLAGVAFDVVEDGVHSVAATLIGFAFAAGVLAVALGRHLRGGGIKALDVAALVASVLIPLGMGGWPGSVGLLQRTMFLIAYVWYAIEAFESPSAAVEAVSARQVFADEPSVATRLGDGRTHSSPRPSIPAHRRAGQWRDM